MTVLARTDLRPIAVGAMLLAGAAAVAVAVATHARHHDHPPAYADPATYSMTARPARISVGLSKASVEPCETPSAAGTTPCRQVIVAADGSGIPLTLAPATSYVAWVLPAPASHYRAHDPVCPGATDVVCGMVPAPDPAWDDDTQPGTPVTLEQRDGRWWLPTEVDATTDEIVRLRPLVGGRPAANYLYKLVVRS